MAFHGPAGLARAACGALRRRAESRRAELRLVASTTIECNHAVVTELNIYNMQLAAAMVRPAS